MKLSFIFFVNVNFVGANAVADANEVCIGNRCEDAHRAQVSFFQRQVLSTKSAMDIGQESDDADGGNDNHTLRVQDLADLCDAGNAMNLANRYNAYFGQPSANNLGNKGPEEGEESLRFTNIFPSAEEPVDLIVVADGEYTPKNSDRNGLENGLYGTVNVQTGTSVNLRYKFVYSGTGNPITTTAFMMTFYDFDADKLGFASESVTFSGFSSYKTADDSELSLLQHDDGSLTVTATQYGNRSDNPISPLSLTDLMKKKAISITFPALSEFEIVFSSTASRKLRPGGRNLLFGGPSSLECPVQPTCDSFDCPSDMVQIPFAEFNNGADNVACCTYKATCATHTCSQGKILGVKALETVCAGIECASTDDDQCCEEENVLCENKAQQLKLKSILVNNLGGEGPDTGLDKTITYGNVFPKADVAVNLVISVVGNYTPKDSARNGKKGKFGAINVKAGNEAGLKFSFVNAATGITQTVPGFLFTIYDLDCGGSDGTVYEYATVSGYSSYKTFETTDVLAEPTDASSGTFFGTVIGYGLDNANNPSELTDLQKKGLVSFEFPETKEFYLSFGAPEGQGGRNMFFRGASFLQCS